MRPANLSLTLSLSLVVCGALGMPSVAQAVPVVTVFEAIGADAAGLTPTRDAFRAAVGGGTVAGANGSFGGLRREINWDGVPALRADPNALPADFFNVNSPRGVVFSTPGSGFAVSAAAGDASPVLFGFPGDFNTFSAQRLFTAIGSPITDVLFFLPGTATAATTSAFGVIFTDVETQGATQLAFYDSSDTLIWSREVMISGNQGLSFLGATVSGASIARVRITSGLNTVLANGQLGNPNDDVVVMDDFLYAEPALAVPEPGSAALFALGLAGALAAARRRRHLVPKMRSPASPSPGTM